MVQHRPCTHLVQICWRLTWGIKYSGHNNFKTGCKDKDKFTAQLDIAKSGKKLITFLLFKGENTAYSSIFALF